MAATACLYNLSKGEMGTKIHPLWLAKLVELTLDAMQNFPNHQQVGCGMATSHVFVAFEAKHRNCIFGRSFVTVMSSRIVFVS